MTNQCYECKSIEINGQWVNSNFTKDPELNKILSDISHGLCPECRQKQDETINQRLDDLESEVRAIQNKHRRLGGV